MCTVTYLPLSGPSFILTSNRDESLYRKTALPPEKYRVYNSDVYFPKDADANGTWFAAEDGNFTLCLLNGAFERHERHPPYRLSRGLMLLDFFRYRDAPVFHSQYDFRGIEPFTLLIFEQNQGKRIYEILWDGAKAHLATKDAAAAHIWSSPQLYPESVIRWREHSFDEWLKAKNEFTVENILAFHKIPGNLLTNHDGLVFTVSITSVIRGEQEGIMRYEDVITGIGVTEIKVG